MKAITTNIGRADQLARLAVGLLLIVLFALGTIGAWGLVGIVPLATGLVRFCPLYRALGISTCGVDTARLP